ncbi:ABC transporter substrate-binding protein [Limoniibacter endophyticus]|uniref:ABC transporter substrate-binding protein n=1 Tax=Limoniibacter endophyticus TaxID=1565040 RepID=A0A8J3DUN9_9HYPH|nr:ABC transporter substrate-binding protein [Limoniibacter endophyticus]GHC78919.1 ABC transporter substrate-binding protein [Limoniibacter endophyticus]
MLLMGAAVLALGLVGTAGAEQLRIGVSADVTSMDPHFYNATPNNEIAFHVFDTLTWVETSGEMVGRLATGWKAVTDTEWQITLRPDVKWHDGSAFTADDVVYSLKRLSTVEGAGGFASLLNTMTDVEKIDDLTVRITTSSPAPNIPRALALIAIVPAANEGKATPDYNSGTAMIGTGPYKFASYVPGTGVKLAANPDWWGGDLPWSEVEFTLVTNPAVRTTALLSGDFDVVQMPPATDLSRIDADPNYKIIKGPALRVAYVNPIRAIAADGEGITGPDGKVLDPSPLEDLRVREALSLAINREGLVDRIMLGTGAATSQMMPPGGYGFIPGLPELGYDPQKAKALLAEAGYPDGFSLSLTVASDRVPLNVDVAQAIVQMWSRIGVNATVNAVPTAVYSNVGAGQKIPVYLGSMGNSSGEVGATLVSLLQTYDKEKATGSYNWSRYSNAEFDKILSAAMTAMDTAEREELLRQATGVMLKDFGVIPLYHITNIWAAREGLTLDTRPDAMTIAWRVLPVSK